MSLSTRLISTAASATLLLTGVVGGCAGNLIADQNAADLAARENVATLVAQNLTAVDHLAGTQARATLDEFASVTDAASALVTSSDGKASQDARNALQSILDEIKVKVAAHVETGAEARDTANQIVALGTPAIEAASKVVTDEVAAWEAEQARIAAEKAAAEAAAQAEREAAQRSSGEYSNSNSNNGGGSDGGSSGGSSNGGGGNSGGGGGGSFRDWIASEAAAYGVSVSYIDGTISYGMRNRIEIANVVADAGGDRAIRVVRHEIAHAIAYRPGNCMDAGVNTEVTAQYVTMRIWGFYVDNYRAPTAAENDALRAICG